MPTAADSEISAASPETDGVGSAPSGSVRKMPTRSRSSSSAWQPAARSSSAAFLVAWSVAVMLSAPACSTIRLTRCVTTSCISPAILARSSALACSASRWRSRSARSARSRSARIATPLAPKYSASRGPSAVRSMAIVITVADGSQTLATITVSRPTAANATRRSFR